MKIFISWSGKRSHAVAEALREWIPGVLQFVDPWLSDQDIEAGVRWGREIQDQLSEIRFGIICLTQENQYKPWILFEADALAKTLRDTFVVPYLIDLEPADIEGPLAQFQAKRSNQQETWALIRSMNRSLGESSLEEARVKRIFDLNWPRLKEALESLPAPSDELKGARSEENILREVLELARGISKQTRQQTFELARTRRDLVHGVRTPRQPRLRVTEDSVTVYDTEVEAAAEAAWLEEEAMREAAMEAAMQDAALEEALIEQEINEATAQDAAAEEAMDAEEARLEIEIDEAAMRGIDPEDEADSQSRER